MKHEFDPKQFLWTLHQLPSPCTIELPKDDYIHLATWLDRRQSVYRSTRDDDVVSEDHAFGILILNTPVGPITVKSAESVLKRADRDIWEQTIQTPQKLFPFKHGEVKRLATPATMCLSCVLTADRGRVALPATVVAHDCPEYGSRFVTEGGTCPDCGYLAYGQTSVAADDVPEDDTEKSELTCDCGNPQPHVPNGLNCWRPV